MKNSLISRTMANFCYFRDISRTQTEFQDISGISRISRISRTGGHPVSVEWLFGEIKNYYKFIDFKKSLKVQVSAVGKSFIVCAILQNARSCLYGSVTSKSFDYFI